jgi:hypothetical protein
VEVIGVELLLDVIQDSFIILWTNN